LQSIVAAEVGPNARTRKGKDQMKTPMPIRMHASMGIREIGKGLMIGNF
jgi:hypothetical protein